MTDSAHRLGLARAIYLAMYAKDGGDWNAVETKQVWLEKADFVLATLNAEALARSTSTNGG